VLYLRLTLKASLNNFQSFLKSEICSEIFPFNYLKFITRVLITDYPELWACRRVEGLLPSTAPFDCFALRANGDAQGQRRRSGPTETLRANGDAQGQRRSSGTTETLRANGDAQGQRRRSGLTEKLRANGDAQGQRRRSERTETIRANGDDLRAG